MIEFTPWPKTPRLNRDMIVTEKIDGTNSAVGIKLIEGGGQPIEEGAEHVLAQVEHGGVEFMVYAQSRKRLLDTSKAGDNYGFAKWVQANAEALVKALGPGLHFGEWWGRGIQRGYGVEGRYFSLFNVNRYGGIAFEDYDLWTVDTVPVLYEGPFDTRAVQVFEESLREHGSVAVPGYSHPEGVVVFHTAGQHVYKVLLEGDDRAKSAHVPALAGSGV